MNFFQTPCVKIILKDPNISIKVELASLGLENDGADESDPAAPGDGAAGAQPPSAPQPEYFIHKSLLSSLSLELYKHINNVMKEGNENVLELSEVDSPTMEAFLGWAYFKDYELPEAQSSISLTTHTKLYVLADRFNIPLLGDLAFSKITALLASLGQPSTRIDILALTAAIIYAYDNLPLHAAGGVPITSISTHSTSPTTHVAPTERLLRYFAHYIAWALEIVRYNDAFIGLLASCPDFAEALVSRCRPAAEAPWEEEEEESASGQGGKGKGKGSRYTVAPSTDAAHVLHRACTCGFTGVMGIVCASCEKYNGDVGISVWRNGRELGVAGGELVSGTKTQIGYKCKYCTVDNTYGPSPQSFIDPLTRGTYMAGPCHGYLWCRKCHKRGYMGTISVVP